VRTQASPSTADFYRMVQEHLVCDKPLGSKTVV